MLKSAFFFLVDFTDVSFSASNNQMLQETCRLVMNLVDVGRPELGQDITGVSGLLSQGGSEKSGHRVGLLQLMRINSSPRRLEVFQRSVIFFEDQK